MPSTLIKEFHDDDVYAPFLEKKFDPKAHASQLVQGIVIAEHLNKLSLGISKLEKEIECQVGSHYEDLLSQASGVGTLEDVLNAMHSRIQTLQAGVERLRARVVEPYNRIERQTLVLGRLQMTCELLRRVLRCLSLSQRLQEQMANCPKDITKAATSLRELDDLGTDVDLSGLSVLEKDQYLIRQARSDVEKQATIMMDRGMEKQNQTQVGTALQVFYNLGILVTSVDKVEEGLVKLLRKSAISALDANALTQSLQEHKKGNGPGHVMMPGSGKSVQFRTNLWSGLEKLMEDIFSVCMKTSHLYKVLAKKRDPVTHVCFLAEVTRLNKEDLFAKVWKNVITILTEEFSKSAAGSNYIRQALEVDYPKLLRLFGDLCKKLEVVSNDVTAARASNVFNEDQNEPEHLSIDEREHKFQPEQSLRNSIMALERAYISRSLSRLFDAVNVMFSTPVMPTKEEIDTLIKTITNELNVSAVDKGLSETVAKNVVKTFQLFCQKCEQLLVTGGEASQVIGPPSPGQQLNVTIVNQLFYVSNQVERTASGTLAHLPPVVTETLITAVPTIAHLMSATVDPLFRSLNETVDAIILTMHHEDFSSKDPISSSEAQCSLYMKEMQSFIARVVTDYINPFQQSPIIKERIQFLASSCLEIFVRHSSLIRPLGEGGKMRLAADFAQMELAINPLASRPSDIGRPYRIFRALRPLLFETVEHIAATPSLGDAIPYSTVLHFLFARAPPEMRSPHETAGWSESRYSTWLDDHSCERERLELVQGALEAYVAGVRSRNQAEFAPIYPFMLDLLQRGLEHVGVTNKNPISLR